MYTDRTGPRYRGQPLSAVEVLTYCIAYICRKTLKLSDTTVVNTHKNCPHCIDRHSFLLAVSLTVPLVAKLLIFNLAVTACRHHVISTLFLYSEVSVLSTTTTFKYLLGKRYRDRARYPRIGKTTQNRPDTYSTGRSHVSRWILINNLLCHDPPCVLV